MPHRRDPMKTEERPWRAAQRQGKGRETEAGDSTPVSHGTDGYTPPGRKSGPGRWVRLADVLLEPGADPALRSVLEAGRHVDAEPGDGAAAFLPDGEVLLLLATPDGLTVRRHAPADEVALFLSDAREAA